MLSLYIIDLLNGNTIPSHFFLLNFLYLVQCLAHGKHIINVLEMNVKDIIHGIDLESLSLDQFNNFVNSN